MQGLPPGGGRPEQQQQQQQQQHDPLSLSLSLRVRRGHVLMDALAQIRGCGSQVCECVCVCEGCVVVLLVVVLRGVG
jgi:hypothetical protein